MSWIETRARLRGEIRSRGASAAVQADQARAKRETSWIRRLLKFRWRRLGPLLAALVWLAQTASAEGGVTCTGNDVTGRSCSGGSGSLVVLVILGILAVLVVMGVFSGRK